MRSPGLRTGDSTTRTLRALTRCTIKRVPEFRSALRLCITMHMAPSQSFMCCESKATLVQSVQRLERSSYAVFVLLVLVFYHGHPCPRVLRWRIWHRPHMLLNAIVDTGHRDARTALQNCRTAWIRSMLDLGARSRWPDRGLWYAQCRSPSRRTIDFDAFCSSMRAS